jgi:hypothetical protein
MDTAATRRAFSEYLKRRYPNDRNISATVSMSFFLCNHESDMGLSLEYALSSKFNADKVLNYYRKTNGFAEFKSDALTDYPTFYGVIEKFRDKFGLDEFNLKQIDQYIWQLGKEYFPKNHGNKTKGKSGTSMT